MSRPSSIAGPPARNPSLLEELEKLEQSITLTLQEIDSNFSRAHRIVTTSIIPIVQEYARHSEAVLDGSKFWKSFFEASANVTLSGYEAPPEDSHVPEDTTATQASSAYDTTITTADDETETGTTVTPPRSRSGQGGPEEAELDSNILSSPSLAAAHSTPRHPSTAKKTTAYTGNEGTATFASYGSPYESLRREMAGQGAHSDATGAPITPAKSHILPDTSMTPDSSPFNPAASAARHRQQQQQQQAQDPLLHRILDKTYRIAATPHRTARKPYHRPASKPSTGMTPAAAARDVTLTRTLALDSSPPDSSPEMAAPQLRAELFNSPLKGARGAGPATPGGDVRTSGAMGARGFVPGSAAKMFRERAAVEGGGTTRLDVWDSDEDELEELGFSPPKTMQFHVPQSRLMQTPAREASKRIVEDILLTAGAGEITDDSVITQEASPSVVRGQAGLDESF